MRIRLPALRLFLEDLLNNRSQDLGLAQIGSAFKPMFQGAYAKLEALPPALTGKLPLVPQIEETDVQHDAFGSASHLIFAAYLSLPDLSSARRAELEKLRTEFMPELGEIRDSYTEEADRAKTRRLKLPQFETSLKSIPVADGGSSLFDWVNAYITAGEQLSVLLSQRADITAESRRAGGALRSEILGLVGALRNGVRSELKYTPGLPADLETRLFAYFDSLEAAARSVESGQKPKAQGSPPAPAPGPEGSSGGE